MNQSGRTRLVLVFIALLVITIFDLAMGIRDRFSADRSIATLAPDLGVLFGTGIVVGAMLVTLSGGLAVGAKLLFGS